MTIEQIINTYPKTDDCELQTLKEVREWQLSEIKPLIFEFAYWYRNETSNYFFNDIDFEEIEEKFNEFQELRQKNGKL